MDFATTLLPISTSTCARICSALGLSVMSVNLDTVSRSVTASPPPTIRETLQQRCQCIWLVCGTGVSWPSSLALDDPSSGWLVCPAQSGVNSSTSKQSTKHTPAKLGGVILASRGVVDLPDAVIWEASWFSALALRPQMPGLQASRSGIAHGPMQRTEFWNFPKSWWSFSYQLIRPVCTREHADGAFFFRTTGRTVRIRNTADGTGLTKKL